jgi:hypothetical protein
MDGILRQHNTLVYKYAYICMNGCTHQAILDDTGEFSATVQQDLQQAMKDFHPRAGSTRALLFMYVCMYVGMYVVMYTLHRAKSH